jgi:hypothetical protein
VWETAVTAVLGLAVLQRCGRNAVLKSSAWTAYSAELHITARSKGGPMCYEELAPDSWHGATAISIDLFGIFYAENA